MATKEILLYDPIGEWDVTSGLFARALTEALGQDIVLRINSPGGEVSHGFAMAALLRAHVGKKTAIIDGFCASAATFPALACDEVHMNSLSMFMVHRSSGGARGHADTFEDVANVLNSLDALAAAEYQRKSGQTAETVAGWMARDTWFTPAQALAAGLCNKVLAGSAPAGAAKATAQTTKFFMHAQRLPAEVISFMTPPAAPAHIPIPTSSTGAKKMKSTPITRGLLLAMTALASYTAQAQASTDPEEKALGEQLAAADHTATLTQLSDVTDAPELDELLRVHNHVAGLAGSKDGLVGFVDGLKAAADSKGQGITAERMVQVEALLATAVNPPKGQPRKLTPQIAAAQRQAYAKDPTRTIADLKQYLKLSPTLPALNTAEDQGAKTPAGALDGDGDPGEADPDFEAGMVAAGNAYKIGGGK